MMRGGGGGGFRAVVVWSDPGVGVECMAVQYPRTGVVGRFHRPGHCPGAVAHPRGATASGHD